MKNLAVYYLFLKNLLLRAMPVLDCGVQRQLILAEKNERGISNLKIPNSKHQITNKSQIPISNDLNRFGFSFFKIIEEFGILNFGHCYLPALLNLR